VEAGPTGVEGAAGSVRQVNNRPNCLPFLRAKKSIGLGIWASG
jgi:hypothetical protein